MDIDLLQGQEDDIDPDAILEDQDEDEVNGEVEDLDGKKEIERMLQDEDIVLMPESSDISELDKLTG